MLKRSLLCLTVLFVLAFLIVGCGTEEDPAINDENIYVDALGREVDIPANPEEVVSLSPAITEILFYIGVEDKIIGVSEYCDYPQEALDKPKMGGFEDPNIELIIESEPDIVFVAAGVQEEVIKTLEDLGITVFSLDAETIEGVLENIQLAGKIMEVEERTLLLIEDLEERVEGVREKVEDVERPTVFFEVWDDPLMTAGSKTFITDMIKIAGGVNLFEDEDQRFPNISVELLFEKDPDIYVAIDHKRQDDIVERHGYESLKAVQEGRVYTIEDDLVTLPGPRVVDGLEEMAVLIHPQIFE